jgi:hypothetical protein
VQAFEAAAPCINSAVHEFPSNHVLQEISPYLVELGFKVETSKKAGDKIRIPVLFGLNGKLEKSFEADAYHEAGGFVVEVEAGRGVANNQFLLTVTDFGGMNAGIRPVTRRPIDSGANPRGSGAG